MEQNNQTELAWNGCSFIPNQYRSVLPKLAKTNQCSPLPSTHQFYQAMLLSYNRLDRGRIKKSISTPSHLAAQAELKEQDLEGFLSHTRGMYNVATDHCMLIVSQGIWNQLVEN